MHDEPQHTIEIPGGMWRYRTTNDRIRATQTPELMVKNAGKKSSSSDAKKVDDQFMLQKYLWPKVKNDVIQNDSFLCKSCPRSIPYPSQRLTNDDVIGGMGNNVVPDNPKDCNPKDQEDWLYC